MPLTMRETFARMLTAAAVAILAAVVGLGGLGFLAAALYLALDGLVPPPAAASLTGGALLLVMTLLFLVSRSLLRPRASGTDAAQSGGPAADPTIEAVTRLLGAITPHARKHLPAAIGGAFAAGLVLGLKPSARRALWRLLTR